MLFALITTGFADTFNYLSSIADDVGNPTGLALDTLGGITYLYASDHLGGRVFKYNLTDGTRVQIAGHGTGPGQFIWPDSIGIDPATHDLYIADRQLHRMSRLTNTGTFLMKWGDTGTQVNRFGFPGAGSDPGQFNEPVGVVVDPAGNVYVSEHENHRIQKFRVTRNTDGTWAVQLLAIWGTGGTYAGQFNTPYCVTLDPAGHVWVADGYNSRLQEFTPDGQYLSEIVVRSATEPHIVNTWVTIDQTGAFYVSVTSDPNTGGDITNQRIQKFSPNGTSVAKWLSYGTGPGQVNLPFGSVIDPATHRLYLSDYWNKRIQIFDLGGAIMPGPLVNLSSRVRVTSGDTSRAAIAGFVVTGTTPKELLVRAVGPSLASYGVTGALTNPKLQIFDQSGKVIAENDDWRGDATVSATGDRVGAFRLPANSLDSALVTTLAPGAYTAQVSAPAGGSGIALVEVYDASTAVTSSSKLLNLSTRGFVDTGEGQLIAGFVVSGASAKRVLIRGIGPGLTSYGVSGVVADPGLKVYAANGSSPIAQNDNWETPQAVNSTQTPASATDIAAANRAAGAFPLASGSKDAAVIVTLSPGNYSAVVSGANNTTGAGLVEVYEIPAP
jgi:sugar lactone lactonase YvrE